MKISELIAELEKAMAEHGDLRVEARNNAGDMDDVEDVSTYIYKFSQVKVVTLG